MGFQLMNKRLDGLSIHVYDFPESESKQIAFLRSFHERVMRGELILPALRSEPQNSALTAAATTAV